MLASGRFFTQQLYFPGPFALLFSMWLFQTFFSLLKSLSPLPLILILSWWSWFQCHQENKNFHKFWPSHLSIYLHHACISAFSSLWMNNPHPVYSRSSPHSRKLLQQISLRQFSPGLEDPSNQIQNAIFSLKTNFSIASSSNYHFIFLLCFLARFLERASSLPILLNNTNQATDTPPKTALSKVAK